MVLITFVMQDVVPDGLDAVLWDRERNARSSATNTVTVGNQFCAGSVGYGGIVNTLWGGSAASAGEDAHGVVRMTLHQIDQTSW